MIMEKNKFIFTDSKEEQDASVTSRREFYIGGSELNKIFDDFYKGDIIQNIFDKLSYTPVDENAGQPDWAIFGHEAEEIIRDYVNRIFKVNYRPAVATYDKLHCRTNVDGYDPKAEHQLWECKTYSGKENIDKYIKQIVYYMLRNNIESLQLNTLNKDVLDENGKKIRNITIEELTDAEIAQRLNTHILKLKDYKMLTKQIDKLIPEYILLYNHIKRSNLMKLYIDDYKKMNEKQDAFINDFMEGFK